VIDVLDREIQLVLRPWFDQSMPTCAAWRVAATSRPSAEYSSLSSTPPTSVLFTKHGVVYLIPEIHIREVS
jgi:hypothetical protein